MAAIPGIAEQCRKMDAFRLGGPFGLSVHGEEQLLGKIVLVNFQFFRKSGNKKPERTSDPTVVDHKLLFGVGEAHDLRYCRVHYHVYAVEWIQRRLFVFNELDCVGKLDRNLIRVLFDPLKRPLLSMLVIQTAPLHYCPQDLADIFIGIPLDCGL